MKTLLRSAAVQEALGWVLGTYLKVIGATVRWRHENLSAVEPVLAGDGGALALYWHGRVPLCMAVRPQWRRKPTKALVSPSADGEFLVRAIAMSGFPAIRMSSAKPGDAAKARAAVAGLREAVAHVSGGGVLVITPDGPRGPREVIALGALQIARRSGQPTFLMGLAASPAWRLWKAWDQMMIALPFGRGAVVWDGPLLVPPQADEAELATLAADWSRRLSAANARAEAMLT